MPINAVKIPFPTGLRVNLLEMPEKSSVTNSDIRFSWVVNSFIKNDFQTAYQILVTTNYTTAKHDCGDSWDSGRVESKQSSAVKYEGVELRQDSTFYWKVRVWNAQGLVSRYSKPQKFKTGQFFKQSIVERYKLEKETILPTRLIHKANNSYFVDFGKAAFGTVKLTINCPMDGHEMWVHLGEVAGQMKNSISSKPGGSRRFRKIKRSLKKGIHTYLVRISPDLKNTGPFAIKMPQGFSEVMPFRYCEIIGCPHQIDKTMIKQIVVHYPFDERASEFESSSKILNEVWQLCKYTIKATSFCGVYVDGDRERVPYEADAYINQLSHYSVDKEFTMARYSCEFLINHSTWPMEFPLYTIMMAWLDYLYTADKKLLEAYYSDLCNKTLIYIQQKNGLVLMDPEQFSPDYKRQIHYAGKREIAPLVDWPHPGFAGSKGETDGFEFKSLNTVINAFHYRVVVLMARIAGVLGKGRDQKKFSDVAQKIKVSFNAKFLDKNRRIYIDGFGSGHSSLHANMYPLAFGLVPKRDIPSVLSLIKTRGMACSVYGAQHLLEALYQAGESDYALKLLTSKSKRGWANMIYEMRSTMTTEAWDNKYKPNQDWNHAWATAPANIIPCWLMGIQPVEAGYGRIRIIPQPGNLKWARIKIPTIKGEIYADFEQDIKNFKMNVVVPVNTAANIYVPTQNKRNVEVFLNGLRQKPTIKTQIGFIDVISFENLTN